MAMLELIQQKAFIGSEFLTWIWFRAEHDRRISPPSGQPVEIELLTPITLEAQYGDARSLTLKGESPATSPEAASALLQGKRLRRAKMKWKREEVEWTVALDGETFNISGIAIPMPGRLPFDDAFAMRMEVLVDFERLLAQIFNQFMELRLDEKLWEKELKKIHAWVRDK